MNLNEHTQRIKDGKCTHACFLPDAADDETSEGLRDGLKGVYKKLCEAMTSPQANVRVVSIYLETANNEDMELFSSVLSSDTKIETILCLPGRDGVPADPLLATKAAANFVAVAKGLATRQPSPAVYMSFCDGLFNEHIAVEVCELISHNKISTLVLGTPLPNALPILFDSLCCLPTLAPNRTSLKQLDLWDVFLSISDLDALDRMVSVDKSIERVNIFVGSGSRDSRHDERSLSNHFISSSICRSLSISSTITHANFMGFELLPHDLRTLLGEHRSSNPFANTVCSLRFSGCTFLHEGVKVIGDFLQKSTQLRLLDIEKCLLGDKGLIYLADCLTKRYILDETGKGDFSCLRVCNNGITLAGLEYFTNSILTNHTLCNTAFYETLLAEVPTRRQQWRKFCEVIDNVTYRNTVMRRSLFDLMEFFLKKLSVVEDPTFEEDVIYPENEIQTQR